jgi:hypothetical protein
MRKGYDNCWLEQGGKIFGINLGSDFTAEHEHGVKELNQCLGVDNKDHLGIEKRRIRKPNVDGVVWVEDGDTAALLIVKPYEVKYFVGRKINELSQELRFYDKEDIATAWSGNDLGILVRGEENIKRLKKIYAAILNKEAAIWLGGGGGFKNAGLCLAIINEIPEDLKKTMHDADVDSNKLMVASEKTGIKQKIDKINSDFREKNKGYGYYDVPCGYYALSPAWINEDHKEKSAYPVVYWLNPMQQDKNNFGWYTVEQLLEWVDEGKGPIPMTEEQMKKRKRA